MANQFLKGQRVWSFGLYVQDGPFDISGRLRDPVKLFNSRSLKLFGGPRDQADPFLIAHEGMLYALYEKLMAGGVGTIACARTADLEKFEDLGVILAARHHLSFPFVFRDGAEILMTPESRQSGEVALYEFADFPFEPRKIRVLLRGSYVDPIVLKKDGFWYLLTTSEDGLEIFFTENLRDGALHAHPANPVVTDLRYSRNGGGPLPLGRSIIRVAQDCSQTYGGNVSFMKIDELSPDVYRESIIRGDFFEKRDPWNNLGAHHLSLATFCGKTVVAADGESRDFLINRLFSRLSH